MLQRTLRGLIALLLAAVSAHYPSADEPHRGIWIHGRGVALIPEDATDIAKNVDNVAVTVMSYKANMSVRRADTEHSATIIATEPRAGLDPRAELSARARWPLERGSFISGADDATAAKVAVIGGPVRDALFGANDPAVGRELEIGGYRYVVKGVLGPHPAFVGVKVPDPDRAATALATRIYIPFRSASDLFGNGAWRERSGIRAKKTPVEPPNDLGIPPTPFEQEFAAAGRLCPAGPSVSPSSGGLAKIRVLVEDQDRIEETANVIRSRIEARCGNSVRMEILTIPDG
ncbi:MAG: ABC transporter permease [Gammaproteobacteria bacterium]|nr:ABC transporter permease [Gammaproteobacteria bacterium]